MPKNIILNSLKETFASIWKNKSLIILLFILQIVFLILFSFISYNYIQKMVKSQMAIEDYLSNIKLDEISVASNMLEQKSILGDDPLLISRNFNEIVKNFRIYLIYIFILLVFSASLFWAITNKMMHKLGFKELMGNFLNIFVILLFYLSLIFAFFFSLLNISLTGVAAESSKLLTKYVPFLIFSIILLYFMFVSMSLTHSTELKNIVQKTLKIGVKKMHYIVSVYFINVLLFAVSIFLLYYFMERNLFILLLSMILILFSFIFGRIFLVDVVKRLD